MTPGGTRSRQPRPACRHRPSAGPRLFPWAALLILCLCLLPFPAARAADKFPAWWAQVQEQADREGYTNITAARLKELLDAHTDMVLLDVRADYEFTRGHIPGAANLEFHLGDRLRLSPGKAEALAKIVGPDKDRLLVIYCRSFK